jgi:hypothetical protein
MRAIALLFVITFATPSFCFIDEDPGLYAEEFSIQAERLGAALDDLGAILEQAVAGDIDEHEGALRSLSEDFDSVYNKLSEWEEIPDEYSLCTAGLEESAVKGGESADELIGYMNTNDTLAPVRAAIKYEEAFEAYSKALDTYPYLIDNSE